MASGFGTKGMTSRCFPFMQDLSTCFRENPNPVDEETGCRVPRDDYLECLHRTKERARLRAVRKEAWEQQQALKQGLTHGDTESSAHH